MNFTDTQKGEICHKLNVILENIENGEEVLDDNDSLLSAEDIETLIDDIDKDSDIDKRFINMILDELHDALSTATDCNDKKLVKEIQNAINLINPKQKPKEGDRFQIQGKNGKVYGKIANSDDFEAFVETMENRPKALYLYDTLENKEIAESIIINISN